MTFAYGAVQGYAGYAAGLPLAQYGGAMPGSAMSGGGIAGGAMSGGGMPGGGLAGYNYPDYTSQQQSVAGAQRVRSHRGSGYGHDDDDDDDDDDDHVYFPSTDSTEANDAGANEQPIPPLVPSQMPMQQPVPGVVPGVVPGAVPGAVPAVAAGQAAFYMQQQQATPVLPMMPPPPRMPAMPAPGFFSSHITASGAGIGSRLTSPALLVAPRPPVVPVPLSESAVRPGADAPTLASMLGNAPMTSQGAAAGSVQHAGGAPLFMSSSASQVAVTTSSSPVNTSYPLSVAKSPLSLTSHPAGNAAVTPEKQQVSPVVIAPSISGNTVPFASRLAASGSSPGKPAPPAPYTVTSPGGASDGGGSDRERHDSYTEPHFEPLVSLPEVETRTGEEDETVVTSHRAKLFRFIDGQWKERGLGDIKILKVTKLQVLVKVLSQYCLRLSV